MSSEADKTPLEIAEMRIAIAGGKRARSLDLSLLGLSQLPDALFECRELKELFLWGNQLEALPTSLIRLTELQILCLQNNRLRALPDFIDRLSRLQTLSLAGNCLQSLPETLDALSELQVLCLHNNQLSSIPESLTQLSRLHTLSLDGNRLKGLPESLGRLAQLQILCLQENQLHSLPGSIVELESLRELFLHSNPALELPDSILGPTFEQVRNRHYSPLDPAVVLDYYFRTRRDARPLNEFKLILVGRGNVGKTSLVTRLVHDKFMIEDITKGIHITEWDITCGGDMSRAHIWDFGGQDIMHGTHQFFLTERSLYVLVLSGRGGAEDQDVEYWLKMIESFGGESPVIVVLNKIDEHQFDLNRSALTLKYPGVKGYVATDCKTGAGISALREMIAREADRLDGLRAKFPASWFAIKERLTRMKEQYLDYEREFRGICASNGETDTDGQDHLASYLHVLGIALNYKDDPRLRETSVLNPRWVTEGIYRLLNAPDIASNGAVLRLQAVASLLPSNVYPREKHLFLLGLMRKFDLCFPLGDSGAEYLVPEQLGKQEPPLGEAFSPAQCLGFEYHYVPMLPEGLLPRFIVRTYAHIALEWRWRTGVVLDFGDNRALVKADVQDRRVIIRVNGPTEGRRRLLAVIRWNFEQIHRDFKKLEPSEKIPVPGHPEILIDYRDLETYERHRYPEIIKIIDGQPKRFRVRELLEGVDVEVARSTGRGVRLFYSYSHKDERFRDEMETHLSLLKREGLLDTWHDRMISAGGEWDKQIRAELERADIIILLVSADFLASEYCWGVEVKRAIERHDSEKEKAYVVPVILRECDWSTSQFARLGAATKNSKPVSNYARRDTAWTEVVLKLRLLIEEIRGTNKRHS